MSRLTLDDLFIATLSGLNHAEAQLAVGLPVLRRAKLERGLDQVIEDEVQRLRGVKRPR